MANAPGLRDLWHSRHRNPHWRAWMDRGVWTDAERSELLRAQRVPTRLPLPYFTAPELSSRAAEKLGEAVAAFERRMSETQVAPNIADMLTAGKKTEYLLNTKEGEFRLYLPETYHGQAVSAATGKPYKLKFVPVFQLIDPDVGHFKTLVDFHLPEAAFKAFRAHVSRYPGCDAKKVPLADEERKARDVARKFATETRVAISAEGARAFREGSEWPMSGDMKHAVRFFDARVATVGMPRETRKCAWGKIDARVDFKLAPWRVTSVERPNWRFKEADPITGDPDDARNDARRNANPRGRR